MRLPQLLALVAVLAAASSPVAAVEYVIITDSSVISPDEAVAKLVASYDSSSPFSTSLRSNNNNNNKNKRTRKAFKVSRKVHLASARKSSSSATSFGLISGDELDDDDQAALKLLPGVRHVVVNEEIRLASSSSSAYTSQWNLDRIDQSFGMDGSYYAVPETGEDIDMYVMDSGVYAAHEAFAGRRHRVLAGVSTASPTGNATEDCVGHGTHVASTAAGLGFGVATSATIIPVQIINCRRVGSLITMVEGVNWILSQMKLRKNKRAIINASIEAHANAGIDALVRQLQSAGAVVVVAAANQNTDACKYSPAREPSAITVGATTSADGKLASSNYGSCVDIFAPGGSIVGAGTDSPSAQSTLQGTSMAAPLVAGVVATIWQRFPHYTNDQVTRVLLDNLATTVKLDGEKGCDGSSSVKFLQALSAAQPVMPAGYASLSVGQKLRSDFLNWSPHLTVTTTTTTQQEEDTMCVAFSAKISSVVSSSYGPDLASFRVAVSSHPLTDGLASKPCDDAAPSYYVVENGPRYAKLSSNTQFDLQTTVHDNAPQQQLFADYAEAFYLVVTTRRHGNQSSSSSSVEIEFGKGGGEDERTRDALVVAQDNSTTAGGAAALLRYLSFSSPNMVNVEFINVRSCNPRSQSPPSGEDTSAGEGALVSRLAITESQRREYTVWPAAWTKPALAVHHCLAFALDDFDGLFGRVSVGFATKPLGRVHVGGLLDVASEVDDADVYELQVSRTATTLLHNGQAVHTEDNLVKIATKHATLMRAVYDDESRTFSVDLLIKTEWRSVYSHTVVKSSSTDAPLPRRRISLASFQPRTFTDIQVC